MVEHYLRLLELADEYAAACKKVEPAWQNALATPTCPHGFSGSLPVTNEPPCCARREAMRAYFEASKEARDAKDALVKHASMGAMEVGVM
jgi:hypothetical protein